MELPASPPPSNGAADFVADDGVPAASQHIVWGYFVGVVVVLGLFWAIGIEWWKWREKKKEKEKEARRELEAAVATATELTDLSGPPSPPAAAAAAAAASPASLPPSSPPLSPLVLPASVVALFKR